MKGILEKAEYEILVATNGRQGLEMAAAHKPGLIITDVLMPDLDGYAFFKECAEKKKQRKFQYSLLPCERIWKIPSWLSGQMPYIQTCHRRKTPQYARNASHQDETICRTTQHRKEKRRKEMKSDAFRQDVL